MLGVSDGLAAVQAALEEAQQSLQDLELAHELQREEFFCTDEHGSPLSSASGSDDSLEAMKLVLEAEVNLVHGPRNVIS